jgi:plastocyanin/mono/diheme cytochrome c family protein
MNTSKQINVMIILMFFLLIVLGAYTLFDPSRQQDAREGQSDLLAQRGASLFVLDCRPCHGDVGQGRVGPALNRPDLRDPAKRDQLQAFVRDTITCGRVGTLMPTWGADHGGALDNEQIRDLVTLITVDPNDAWNRYVRPQSEEANKVATPSAVEDLLKGSLTGSTDSVCGQKVATSATAPPATPGAPSTSLNESATDNKFAATDFTAPAGQAVTLAFSNQGNAIHNWHVTDAKDASGKDVTTGATGTLGGQSTTTTFTIAQPGTYHYQCDFHPTEMLGTLFVVGAQGAGAPSAATPNPAAVPGTTPVAVPTAGATLGTATATGTPPTGSTTLSAGATPTATGTRAP